jgi:hypothetical protein
VHLRPAEGDGRPFTWWGLVLLALGAVRRSRAWLGLDLVATKWLTGSDNGCFGTFALKAFCRGGAIPSCYIFAWYLFQRLVPFANRANLSLLLLLLLFTSGRGLLPTLHSCLSLLFGRLV